MPHPGTGQTGLAIDGVYFKTYDPEGGGTTQAEFVEDTAVTSDLQAHYYWPGYEWHGYSLSNHTLPDSAMVLYVAVRGEQDTLGTGPTYSYLHGMMGDGEWGWSPDHYDSTYVDLSSSAVTRAAPTVFRLGQNQPNPFKAATEIEYSVPAASDVSLTVYNMLGQRVRTLVSEHQEVGTRSTRWDGRNDQGAEVSAGIYFYKLEAGSFTEIKKMILVE